MIKVLALETSCDDTSIAIITNGSKLNERIIYQKTYNQNTEHEKFKGVIPELAARAHLIKLETLLDEALQSTKINLNDLDFFAVTGGPGLMGGVITGLMFIKSLSLSLNKPFYSINHLQGHALTARLSDDVQYPFLLLLISGGHCQFVEVKSFKEYVTIGQSIDDSSGECFDKIASMLDLGFPGGKFVEDFANKGNQKAFNFPMPLKNINNCNLSFSGLKTAIKTQIEKFDKIDDQLKADICASAQYAICNSLVSKFKNAIKMSSFNVERFVIAGGVASNIYIRNSFEKVCNAYHIKLICPPINLCTDNASMIGWSAIEAFENNIPFDKLDVKPKVRWNLDELYKDK